mgnify:CR=1 FL=1
MPPIDDKKTLEKTPPQPTVRESIEASLKELELAGDDKEPDDKNEEIDEGIDLDDESDDPAGEGVIPDEPAKKKKEVKEPDIEAEEEIEASEEEAETEVKEPKAKKTKVAAPENWKDTPDWDKTPPSVRQKIIKREEEVSAGFKQYGAKAQEFDKYEQFIGPRRQSMAKVGVSPEQVIGRALDWMDALGHSDPKVKGESFKILARNFGIDLASLVDNNATGESFRVAADGQQGEVPAQVREYVTTLESKIGELEQRLGGLAETYTSQQDRNAAAYLTNWAKEKPHFAKVQKPMVALIQSGVVPLAADGSLDLDTAYDMAINADPEVRKLVQLEAANKAKKDALTKAKKNRGSKEAQLNNARAASGSLKPGSASISDRKGDPRGLSVRDTIKLSYRQLAS